MTEDTLSIIKVRDILIVTMPADPDDATISALQQKVLLAMERSPAKGNCPGRLGGRIAGLVFRPDNY